MTEWHLKPDATSHYLTDDFYYDLARGGYLKPEDMLAREGEVAKVRNALQTLRSFEMALRGADLLVDA